MKPLDKLTDEIAQELSRRLFIRNSSVTAMGLLFAGNLIGCKKDKKEEYSFNDVLDFTGPDKLKELLSSVNNVDDFPKELVNETETFYEENSFNPFSGNEELAKSALINYQEYATQNYIISDLEKVKLQNGDKETFSNVLNRMLSMPDYIQSELNDSLFSSLENSYFSNYLLKIKNVNSDSEEYNYWDLSKEIESIHASYTTYYLDSVLKINNLITKSRSIFFLPGVGIAIGILIGLAIGGGYVIYELSKIPPMKDRSCGILP